MEAVESDEKYKLFLAFYLLICLIWPSFQGMRLCFVILPFLVLGVLEGLAVLLPQRVKWMYGGLLLFSLLQTAVTCYHYYQKDTNEILTEEMQAIYTFIQAKLPKESKPRTMRLMTQKNAVQKPTILAKYKLQKRKERVQENVLFTTKYYQLIGSE